MKISKLALLSITLILTACNVIPSKKSSTSLEGVGLFKVKLEQADGLYAQKKYHKALTGYQELHKAEPKDTYILFRIANTYSHLKIPKLAIKYYELTLTEDIHMSKAWYNLGVIHMKEAASTWADMMKYVDHDDPLHKSSSHYSRGMLELINPEKP